MCLQTVSQWFKLVAIVCTDFHGAWKEGEHEVCGQSLYYMGDWIWVWPNLHIKLSGELLFDGWMASGVGFELGKATHGVLTRGR